LAILIIEDEVGFMHGNVSDTLLEPGSKNGILTIKEWDMRKIRDQIRRSLLRRIICEGELVRDSNRAR
jgi:hypothetical protein